MISAGQVALMAAKILATKKFEPMSIVEVGTVNGKAFNYPLDGGYSTLHMAYWARERRSVKEFFSLELSQEHIDMGKEVLRWYGLEGFVEFVQGDAAKSLLRFREQDKKFDLAYLDGSSEPNETLTQFSILLPMMRRPAVILIDDVYENPKENKGALVVPEAERLGLETVKVIGRMAAIGLGADGALVNLAELQRT